MGKKNFLKRTFGIGTGMSLIGIPFFSAWLYFSKPAQPRENLETRTQTAVARQADFREQKQEAKQEIKDNKYPDFKYQDELKTILKTAERTGVRPELLLAIRMAENGAKEREFGIIPTKRYNLDKGIMENGKFRPYENGIEKQASWCAWTIIKNYERFKQDNKGHEDFLSYLQEVYCPVGAENDPGGLNVNWKKNVNFWYNKFKKK